MKLTILTLVFISTLLVSINNAFGAENSTNIDAEKNNSVKNSGLFGILDRIGKKQQRYEEIKQENNKTKNLVQSETVVTVTPELLPNDGSGIATGQELILSMYIDKLYLADTFAYKTNKGTKINLYDFFQSLDFPIDIDLTKGIVAGWFIEVNNRFELNLSGLSDKSASAQLIINEQVVDAHAENITIEDGDIYVDGATLAKWFDFEISYNFNDQIVIIQSQRNLPIQAKLARERRKIYTKNTNASVMPWKNSNYEMFSSPLIDFQFNTSTNDDNNNNVNASALGQHDLGYFSSEYYLSGNDESLTDARFKLSKVIPEKSIFSSLSGANFEMGDIRGTQISNLYSSRLSRGFSVTSNLDNDISFNRVNLNGDIQPGWDIELYRNTILIDKQISVQNGRYEFNNIDLLYGNNFFEMILYGPQGQVEKRTKEVYLDQNMLSANDASYSFSATQEGKSIFNVNSNNSNVFGEEGFRIAGQYGRGINKSLSVDFGLSSFIQSDDEKEDRYTSSLGMDLQLFDRLLLSSNNTFDNQKNMANNITARMPWSNHSFLYEYQRTESNLLITDSATDIESEDKNIRKYQRITMNGPVFTGESLRLNYQNIFGYDVKENAEITDFTNSLSANFKRYMLQNTFRWQETKTDFYDLATVDGALSFNTYLGTIFTRLSSSYTIKPVAKITSVSTDLSWNASENIYSNVRVSYAPETKRYNSRFAVNWHNESLNVSTYANVNSDDEWSVGLLFRFSLGYHADYNKTFISSTPLSSAGTAMVRVYKDDNANNQFDEGESLINGVKVKAVQSYRQGISGEDGIAVIKGLINNKKTDLAIDPSTFEDPFLIPLGQGVAFTPRRGYLNSFDYPVVTASEIDGIVYFEDKEGLKTPLSFAEIHLVNEAGEVVTKTRTEYDGYYLFVDLPPGQYKVSISDEYIKKQKLYNTDDLSIVLTAQGDVINGSDFILSQLEFTSGYVANIGQFSSLNMLKAYWYLLNRRNRAKLKHSVFYVKDDLTNKYHLNLAFYKTKNEAYTACEAASKVKINCNVAAHELVIK
jgi:hypothetical protein